MQPARELAQLGQRVIELVGGGPQQRRLRLGQPLLQHPKLDGERDQPLLRTVVQVALEPPALGHAGLQDPDPRRGQLRARLGALQRQRDEFGEPGQPVLGVLAQRRADATSSSPHVPPPTTIGAATAER